MNWSATPIPIMLTICKLEYILKEIAMLTICKLEYILKEIAMLTICKLEYVLKEIALEFLFCFEDLLWI